jgi:hypothetical protein
MATAKEDGMRPNDVPGDDRRAATAGYVRCAGLSTVNGDPCGRPADYLVDEVPTCRRHIGQQARWGLDRGSTVAVVVRIDSPRPRLLPAVYKPRHPERDAEIARLIVAGDTLQAIGAKFALTREAVRQIGLKQGVDFAELRAEQNAARDRRRAEAEAAAEASRWSTCLVCRRPFRRSRQQTICGSDDCKLILSQGRRYLDAEHFEKQRRAIAGGVLKHPERHTPAQVRYARRVVAGQVAPNRRYVVPGSKIAEALRRAGRDDLLPPPCPTPKPHRLEYRCGATNLDGTPCSRGVVDEGQLCHIHQGNAGRSGRPGPKLWTAEALARVAAVDAGSGLDGIMQTFGVKRSTAYGLRYRARDTTA